jgi:hypothetical protein
VAPTDSSSQPVTLVPRALDDASEQELRAVVERSWSRLCCIVDRTMASGRFVDRTLLVDLGRWLDGAGTAVRAYERLVVRLRDQALQPQGEAPDGSDPVANRP